MTTNTTIGTTVLTSANLTTAMVAGLLFSFAHSVMPGLGTLDDRGFLTAFQRIDAAISNPWMMLTFKGSPLLTFVALLLHLPSRSQAVPWLVVALALTVATVIITGAIHIPLNTLIQDAAPRLPDAADLLVSSDATIATVARQVGYGTPFSFSAAFKRAHGVSPQRYRLGSASA